MQTILSRIGDICICDNATIGIAANPLGNEFMFSSNSRQGAHLEGGLKCMLSDADVDMLYNNSDHLCLNIAGRLPNYVKSLLEEKTESITILPVFIKEKLSGMIVLAYFGQDSREERAGDSVEARVNEDLKWAGQLRDQVAVALSNSRLLEELDKLSWGALTALARAVDAKSHWTAGHSERVTELALQIGKTMNLTRKQVDTLHRGALLHDIGKIGVPAVVLDKTDKLTDPEFALIKRHPDIGARILEPIESYADIVSIVRGHHERYDGSGYPQGLKGEEISLGARIVAVADVFEAVTADRPYRPGWDIERAVELIRSGSGSHFDPQVASAFLQVVQGAKDKMKTDTGATEADENQSEIDREEAEAGISTIMALMKPEHLNVKRGSVENTHR